MTKAEFITQIASKANLTKIDAERAINALVESIQETLLKEGKLTLIGFGTFLVEQREEHPGRNPRTGEVITVAASKAVKFRPSKILKDALIASKAN